MTTHDFVTELFVRVDDAMTDCKKHSQASLHPSEIVTLGLLFALKGSGNRAFHRWAQRDLLPLFPRLPERTRLFRLLSKWRVWTCRLLSAPTLLGVVDCYGIELIHPRRRGAARVRSAGKARATTAGSSGPNSASSSTASAWWSPTTWTPQTSTTRASTR